MQLDTLISKGYIPKEVVPPITTCQLAGRLDEVIPELSNFPTRESQLYLFSIPRIQHARRMLGIPNPLHQLRLSKEVTDSWDEIQSFISSPNSLATSTPTLSPPSERALDFKCDYEEMKVERVSQSVGRRYLLRADISRFYGTLYTHSIAWALHGKTIARTKRGDSSLLGNRLDKAIRNTVSGQTLGIPIGPDTSFLIADIIGVAMDTRLRKLLQRSRGIRHVDDYYLYFGTQSEAEDALNSLHMVAREFQLELNPDKTQITDLPEQLSPEWVLELRSHRFRKSALGQRNDLISYFSKAFEYAHRFKDEFVLKYAVSRIKALTVESSNWRMYNSLLLRCAIDDPNVIPVAIAIIKAYRAIGYSRLPRAASETVHALLAHHARFHNAFELTWALWMAKELRIKIRGKEAKVLSQIDDSITNLVSLDLVQEGLLPNDAIADEWCKLMTKGELYGDHWLLAYEANVKEWLTGPKGDNVSADDFFGKLKALDVSFYEAAKSVTPVALLSPDMVSGPKGFGYDGGGGY